MKKRIAVILVVLLLAGGAIALALNAPPETVFPPATVQDSALADRFQIITVQMHWKLEDYQSPAAFREAIAALVEEGMAKSEAGLPTLIVFPEDVGLPLTMMDDMAAIIDNTGWEAAAKEAVIRNGLPVMWNQWRYDVGPMRAFALSQAAAVGKTYVDTFSELARQHQVYIIAGTAPLPDFPLGEDGGRIEYAVADGNVYNVAYFFGPDGRIIGRQKKVYLIEMEQAGGIDLSNGTLEELKVFETPFGSIGIAVCLDGFREDVLDRLAAGGAEILVQPSANPGAWDKEQQDGWLYSSWKATQERPQFDCAINPMMTGNIFDLPFEGQSSVAVRGAQGATGYAESPVEQGFAAVADGHKTEEVLVTTFERTEDGIRPEGVAISETAPASAPS
jgi:predicted amidohydrolase